MMVGWIKGRSKSRSEKIRGRKRVFRHQVTEVMAAVGTIKASQRESHPNPRICKYDVTWQGEIKFEDVIKFC